MAQDYTITAARNAGEKDNPHGGKLVKWYLNLADSEAGTDDVYVQKKPGNDLSPGMTIYGRLEKGEFGWRIFPEQNPNAGGGNFKAPSYERLPEGRVGPTDPQAERSRRIERQHSQEMAIRAIACPDLLPPGDRSMTIEEAKALLRHWTDFFQQDLDADLGGGGASQTEAHPPATADVSAGGPAVVAKDEQGNELPTEASPAQKRKLTTLFNEAQIAKPAQKAIVLFRCRSEKATKDGASQLITDLLEGATHDQLIAEVRDAARAGNDPVATRAAALIPSEVPADTEGLPELDETEKAKLEDVPF